MSVHTVGEGTLIRSTSCHKPLTLLYINSTIQIAGALAEQGCSLEEIAQVAEDVAKCVGRCTVRELSVIQLYEIRTPYKILNLAFMTYCV